MDDTRLSKRLSYVLRHDPGSIGLSLDAGGWVGIATLLQALARHGVVVDRDRLESLVLSNDKQRFAIDQATDRIRANQGHSLAVDLGLTATAPPAVLYHGTPARNVRAILAEGLHAAGRHAVHLSPDVSTAHRVGARRGRSVVLSVDASTMHADGFRFEVSANGVWLTEHVPQHYLARVPDDVA